MSAVHGDDSENLRGRAVSGAKWATVQKWYAKLAGLLTTLVLARLLVPADFGLVALAIAFVSVATVLIEAGFAPSLVQAKEVSRLTASTAFWVSILLSLVLVGVVQALAHPIALGLHQPGLEPLLRVLSILMPISALSSVQVALLNRQLKMKSLALRQVLSVTAGAVLGVLGALLGWGAWALVAQNLAAAVVGVVTLWAATTWRPQFAFSKSDAKGLVRRGGAILGTNLIHQLRDRGDEFLIGGILGAELLGYWTVGTRLVKFAIDLFYSVVSAITFPVLSRVRDDRARFARGVQTGITLNLFLVLPTLAGLSVATPLLVPLIFGGQWVPAVPAAQIYSVAIAIGVFQWLDSQIWWARGQFRMEFYLSSAISAFHLLSVALAAPYGLVAIALAVLARTLITAPVRLFVLLRHTDLTIAVYRNAPRTVAAVLVMSVCGWGVMTATIEWSPWLSAATVVIAGLVSYLLASLVAQRETVRSIGSLVAPRLRGRRGGGPAPEPT